MALSTRRCSTKSLSGLGRRSDKSICRLVDGWGRAHLTHPGPEEEGPGPELWTAGSDGESGGGGLRPRAAGPGVRTLSVVDHGECSNTSGLVAARCGQGKSPCDELWIRPQLWRRQLQGSAVVAAGGPWVGHHPKG